MSDQTGFVPYHRPRIDPANLADRAREIYEEADGRRSVREFSDEPVPREAIDHLVRHLFAPDAA